MANIFLTYDGKDRDLARNLEAEIKKLNHEIVWGVDELIAGRGWGELMPRRIANADAVVALLTPNSVNTPSVWCEVGAARALGNTEKRTALLPVIIGLESKPNSLRDILVLWDNENLVSEIDSAIKAHLASIEARAESPKIFISHRHKDQKIAEALTDVITTALDVRPAEIRCTSVQPYRLPFGKNTGERLRGEIASAQVVLGILSPDTAESTYVMFELGAAWSQHVYTCPLLSRGAELQHIPAPIFDLAPARLHVRSDCAQLLENLASELGIPRKEAQGATSQKIDKLVEVASLPESQTGVGASY